MKATMVKKLNTIVSLWLVAIIAALVIFGYELNMFGFYVAAIVVGVPLLISNVFTIATGLVSQTRFAKEQETEYRNY